MVYVRVGVLLRRMRWCDKIIDSAKLPFLDLAAVQD